MGARLFTIFLDRAGGTYISQRRATSAQEAITLHLKDEGLADQVADPALTNVEGLVGVWCTSGLDSANVCCLFHVVDTATEADEVLVK